MFKINFTRKQNAEVWYSSSQMMNHIVSLGENENVPIYNEAVERYFKFQNRIANNIYVSYQWNISDAHLY